MASLGEGEGSRELTELVLCPEEEPGWQRIAPLGEPWEGRKLFLVPRGTPVACVCPKAGCCSPGMPQRVQGQEAPGTVFPANGIPLGHGNCCQLFHRLPQVAGAGHFQMTRKEVL